MSRHRTVMTPQERRRWLARTAARLVGWLALGAVVGAVTWLALRWAGATPGTTWWLSGAVAVAAAAGAGIASSLPKPADEPAAPPAP